MRWVFIRPQRRSPYYDPEIQEPLGIQYLAAARRQAGDTVMVLDSSLDRLSDIKLARRALSFQPNAIGFSITTADELPSVMAIHRECSTQLQDRKLHWVAGGNFVSTEASRAAASLALEIALVRFEGERALDTLAKFWEKDESPVGPKYPAATLCGEPVVDLDALPFPIRPYAEAILHCGWAFNLQGSRGCLGACRYCASPGMSPSIAGRWRGRSPENVADEIAAIQARFNARSFNFVDEDFLGPNHLAVDRARAFADAIRNRRLDIAFSIQVRPASLSYDIIDILTDIGLTYVFTGIESDLEEDFIRWGRPHVRNPWRLVHRLRQRGAEVNAGTMLFHSHATLAGIRRFARALQRHNLLEYRSAINRLDAMPGSVFYDAGIADGTLDPAIPGPQAIPFMCPEVEALHTDLMAALEPLGPPSMHALCAVPPLLSRQRFEPEAAGAIGTLRAIIARLDNAVAASLFQLLDRYESPSKSNGLVAELRTCNLRTAEAGARELVDSGFASSFDELREAIRIDAGM